MNTFPSNKKKASDFSWYLFYIAEDIFLCISLCITLTPSVSLSISLSTLRDECTKAPGRICRVDWNTKVWHSGFNKKIKIPIVSAFWCVFKSNGLHDPLQVMAHNFKAVFLKSCEIIGIKTCMFHSGFHYGTKKHFSRMQSMAGMFTSMWHLAYSKINHFRRQLLFQDFHADFFKVEKACRRCCTVW